MYVTNIGNSTFVSKVRVEAWTFEGPGACRQPDSACFLCSLPGMG